MLQNSWKSYNGTTSLNLAITTAVKNTFKVAHYKTNTRKSSSNVIVYHYGISDPSVIALKADTRLEVTGQY